MKAPCNGRESRFIEPLTQYGEPPNPSIVRLPWVCGRVPEGRPPGPAPGNLRPVSLMVHLLNLHSYLPFETGKSDSSMPKTTAVPPGRWGNNAPATTAGAPPASESKQLLCVSRERI